MLTDIQLLVIFLAFTLGAILRTLWGWLWKVLENPDLTFDRKYWLQMIVSIVLTFIFALTTFSTLDLTLEWNPMIAFTFVTTGFTMNSIFNDILSFVRRPKTTPES